VTYSRPSLNDLNARIEADLAAVPAVLRKPLRVMWSRAAHGMHGMLDWVLAQCSPLTCDEDRLPDWAALYGVDRLLAAAASGKVVATGNVGAIVLAGTELKGPNGLNYLVGDAVEIGTGTTLVWVKCTTTGVASNVATGSVLTLIDPLLGVDMNMTVDANGITGGAEDETVDAWRLRVADEWQTVTTTGARSGKPEDYRAWAKNAHQSVTTALVQLHTLGMGSVVVRPICDGLPNRQPTQGVLDAVAAYFASVVPACADWRVVAPIPRLVSPSIHLLPGYDTADNRAAISSAFRASVLAETSEDAVLLLAEIDGAVQTVTTQYARLAPVSDVAVSPGEVLVPGDIAWA
jgi:uncharacterized phage protein gp47/JayE